MAEILEDGDGIHVIFMVGATENDVRVVIDKAFIRETGKEGIELMVDILTDAALKNGWLGRCMKEASERVERFTKDAVSMLRGQGNSKMS